MKKVIYYFLLSILCFINLNSYSQSEGALDSLKIEFHTAQHDTSKLKLLYEIIYLESNGEKKLKYNQYMKTLAELNASLAKGIMKTFYLRYQAQALTDIAYQYSLKGDFITALTYNQKSLAIYEKIEDKYEIATVLNSRGQIYQLRGDIKNALETYDKSLLIQNEVNDKKRVADVLNITLNNLGLLYYEQGNITKALEYYHQSLVLSETINDRQGMAPTFINIGQVYESQDDISKALEYYDKGLEMQQKIGDKNGEAGSLNNIGAIYYKKEDLDKALNYFKEALNIYIETGEQFGMASSLSNIGMTYGKRNDMNHALEYCIQSFEVRKKMDDRQGMTYSLINIGELYFKQKNISKALIYFTESLKLSQELGFPAEISKAAVNLSNVYKQKGNYKDALRMHELYMQMHDSINNDNTKKGILKQQLKYEYDKKEAVYKVQQLEQEAKVKHKNILLVTSLLSIFLMFLAYYFYQERRKLKLKNEALHFEQKALRSQMNPHFIFNSMNSIQSFIARNDTLSAGKYLSRFSRLIRKVLENSRKETISLEEEMTDLENYVALEKLRFNDKFDFSFQVDKGIDTSEIQIPSMLIQPYVENAIIHGLANKEGKGKLSISFQKEEKFLLCSIEDNGVGRKIAMQIKQRMGDAHTSLGMSIINERLDIINKKHKTPVHVTISDVIDDQQEIRGTKVELKISFQGNNY